MRLRLSRAALFASAALAASPALAQASQGAPAHEAPIGQAADAADAGAVDELVVTGLRGEARTVTDSPAPIDVISAQQLTDTGKVGLKEVLNTLVPSFNLPGINGGGTSWTVRAITLRGLNGDQALFLVNGKRRHTTALINNLARVGRAGVPVDLDLIPAAAIKRIEVLRDGAAAQYGTDAIAGVINIILKDDAEGGEASFTAGQNYLSDGRTVSASIDWGRKLGEDGFLNLAFNWKNNAPASRSVPSQAAFIYPALANGQPDPRDATVDRYYWGRGYGPGEEDVMAASYNAELPWKDGVTLFQGRIETGRRPDDRACHRGPLHRLWRLRRGLPRQRVRIRPGRAAGHRAPGRLPDLLPVRTLLPG